MARGQIALLISALTLAAVSPTGAQTPLPPPPYVVLGAQGPVARAIMIPDANKNIPACPPIEVDNTPKQMTVRAEPEGGNFNIRVCEFALGSAKKAKIGEDALPLPKEQVNSIAVFGDTGCRIKVKKASAQQMAHDSDEADEESAKKDKIQDCKDPALWPFETVSNTIANSNPGPDLVIHVGDYLYRESACPVKYKKDCGGSPFGDDWPTWAADFFTPATKLLKVAPWIVVRGNHEICDRAGKGYALLLDPAPVSGGTPPKCVDMIDQYPVTVGGRNFIILDSSNAADECPCDSDTYKKQFEAMKGLAPGTWLLTHKPIWGFTYSKNKKGKRVIGIRNMTLQGALKNKKFNNVPPAGITLVLSGHIHLWEALSFDDERSPQFVLGSGGTDLAHELPKKKLKHYPIDGTKIAAIASDHQFGYTLFQNQSGAWSATLYDPTGNAKLSCTVEPTTATCEQP